MNFFCYLVQTGLCFEIRCYITNGLFDAAEIGPFFLFHFSFFDSTKLEARKPVFNPKLAEFVSNAADVKNSTAYIQLPPSLQKHIYRTLLDLLADRHLRQRYPQAYQLQWCQTGLSFLADQQH